MALLTQRAPVSYEEQQRKSRFDSTGSCSDYSRTTVAFEEFLTNFKTSPKSAAGITNALDGMNIDEDDFSDEYDFMDDDDDDDDGAQNERRRARAEAKKPRQKYVELLQKVADREEDEITIDLDDLATVWFTERLDCANADLRFSTTNYSMRTVLLRNW